MNNQYTTTSQRTLSISLDRLAMLAIEHWRLSTVLAPSLTASAAAPVRHALRMMDDFFKSCNLEVRALDGQPYDPGMAARVVDTHTDDAMPRGAAKVIETISPMILCENMVIRPADVVVAANPS